MLQLPDSIRGVTTLLPASRRSYNAALRRRPSCQRFEIFQLHVQHGRLDRGQAEHAADVFVMILMPRPVHAQEPANLGEGVVVGADRPGVAERAQVLRRIKAQTSRRRPMSTRACRCAWRRSPGRHPRSLSDPCLAGDLVDGFQVRQLPEKIDRNDRPGPGRDFGGDLGRIDIERRRIDVRRKRLWPRVARSHPAVAKKVKVGQITSSPGLMPMAISEQSSASLPLLTPMACFVPQYAARFFSNFSTCGPSTSDC